MERILTFGAVAFLMIGVRAHEIPLAGKEDRERERQGSLGMASSDWWERDGRELMRLCNVPPGNGRKPAVRWKRPVAFGIGAREFLTGPSVAWSEDFSEEAVFENTGMGVVQRAAYRICVAGNEAENRLKFFTERVACNIGLRHVAKGLKVEPSADGAIRIADTYLYLPFKWIAADPHGRQPLGIGHLESGVFRDAERWREAIILHNNITVVVAAPTNAFEIADALLEAGLKKAREEKTLGEEFRRVGK